MAEETKPVNPALDGGPMTRAVRDVTGAAEALTVGAVHLAHSTLAAAVETVEDVGGRLGSLAVATVRGATKAAADIGGDLGGLAKGTVQGSLKAVREIGGQLSDAIGGEVGSLAVDAMEETVHAVDRIGSTAGRTLRGAVSGTVAGVKTALGEVGAAGGNSRRPLARSPQPESRPLARAARSKRSAGTKPTAKSA
jgi:hypothetical protein